MVPQNCGALAVCLISCPRIGIGTPAIAGGLEPEDAELRNSPL